MAMHPSPCHSGLAVGGAAAGMAVAEVTTAAVVVFAAAASITDYCHFLSSALLPCAPRPSSSANFFTDFSAFLSDARLYSTTLVLRWN